MDLKWTFQYPVDHDGCRLPGNGIAVWDAESYRRTARDLPSALDQDAGWVRDSASSVPMSLATWPFGALIAIQKQARNPRPPGVALRHHG